MKCLICEKEFENTQFLTNHIFKFHKLKIKNYYDLYLKKENEGICLNCNKPTKFYKLNKGYAKFCSLYCMQTSKYIKEKRKETIKEKYGVEHALQNKEIHEKQKQTVIEKYGVENPFQSIEIKQKIKETNLSRYGVENPTQNKKIREKQKQSCLEHYGVEYSLQNKEIREKCKQTCIERYGVEYPSQNKQIHEKQKQTILKRYGIEYPIQCNEIKEKIKQSCLERYGVEYPIQSEYIKEKQKQICLEKYGAEYYQQSIDYKEYRYNIWLKFFNQKIKKFNFSFLLKNNNYIELLCNRCNNKFEYSIATVNKYLRKDVDLCPYCNPRLKNISNLEKELLQYIKLIYQGEIIENDRSVLGNYELDIYLPEKKIAFEFNGLYWHSIIKRNNNYHLNKTIKCEKQGIQLVHIFEDKWINNSYFIKNYINDLIYNKINIDKYNLVFKKEDNKIIVDRHMNNGYLLEIMGYKLIEIKEPILNEIEFQNIIYKIYDCGKLVYEK